MNLWAEITGADKKKQRPEQQTVALGRVGAHAIIFPHGMFTDLPNGALIKEVEEGAAISVTVERPSDTETGEPTFFHPSTNTRIIFRNNGDLDIITDSDTAGNININTVNANITCTEDVSVTCVNANLTASADITASCVNATLTATTDATVNCATGNINASTSLTVTSPLTDLGPGGAAIARVGDAVEVIVVGGSSAGTHTGTITSGGANKSI